MDEIGRFLASLSPEALEVVCALREVVRQAAPDAEETVLWGGLSYHTPWIGGRVKGAVCQVTVKRGQVRLEFIHGVRLTDPCRLLQGDRLSKRYVPVASAEAAQRPEVVALVRDASAMEIWPGA